MNYLIFGVLAFWLQGVSANFEKASEDHKSICYGSVKAPLLIIEYSSPSCIVCAKFMEQIFPKLEKEYIKTGKVRLTVRDFPFNYIDLKAGLIIHGSSDPCKFHQIIYSQQNRWITAKDPLKEIIKIARASGMSKKAIDRALQNKKLEDILVASRMAGAAQYKIEGVPIFIIGSKIITGLIPWKDFKRDLDKALLHIKSGEPLKTFGETVRRSKHA